MRWQNSKGCNCVVTKKARTTKYRTRQKKILTVKYSGGLVCNKFMQPQHGIYIPCIIFMQQHDYC